MKKISTIKSIQVDIDTWRKLKMLSAEKETSIRDLVKNMVDRKKFARRKEDKAGS